MGKQFPTPCSAFASAVDGDTVEIDGSGGAYTGDVCGIYPNKLTIRGVNGRPKIDAGGLNSMGKGTWVVIGAGTVVDNVEMFGAKVTDKNGAAIRLDYGYNDNFDGHYYFDDNGCHDYDNR